MAVIDRALRGCAGGGEDAGVESALFGGVDDVLDPGPRRQDRGLVAAVPALIDPGREVLTGGREMRMTS